MAVFLLLFAVVIIILWLIYFKILIRTGLIHIFIYSFIATNAFIFILQIFNPLFLEHQTLEYLNIAGVVAYLQFFVFMGIGIYKTGRHIYFSIKKCYKKFKDKRQLKRVKRMVSDFEKAKKEKQTTPKR